MRIKYLLGAVCAASLMAGVASAGETKIRVINVNTGAPDEMDKNDPPGPPNTLNVDMLGTRATVEGSPLQGGVTQIITPHRDIRADKPMEAHWEIEVFEVTGTPTFTGPLLVKIELLGDAKPEWKKDLSFNKIVRPGSDGIFSFSAEPAPDLGPGQPAPALLFEGETTAEFVLEAATGGENALGFLLPVRLTMCGRFDVKITITGLFGINTITRTFSTEPSEQDSPLAVCGEPSIMATAITPADLMVDVGGRLDDGGTNAAHPFSLFLKPDGLSGKGFKTELMHGVGTVNLWIKNHLFDPKVKVADDYIDHDRLFDVGDIKKYTLQYTFESLEGIASLNLRHCNVFADLNHTNGTATWMLDSGQIEDCFDLSGDPIKPNGSQHGVASFKITATGLGRIQTQKVALTKHEVEFDMSGTAATDPMFVSAPFQLQDLTDDAFRIVRKGLNFGPFDWATANGFGTIKSVFRTSGLPDVPLWQQGIVFVENSSTGLDGFCEFDVSPFVNNGELLFTSMRLHNILNNPACFIDGGGMGSLADFGRADLTFSWFIPSPFGDKVDMDRLLNSDGIFADYGDNGNDAFSLKARSCDPGRFGGHTVNNLSGVQADFLLFLCRTGDFPLRQ